MISFATCVRSPAASGAALIFDEVVTGFRVHPGGMQAVLGIKADMATYGKVVGGGMPIGVLAGTARFMDALDGGYWQFGDASVPEVAPTFFAGTFVRHPLVLAAAKAVLEHLKAAGPALQDSLSATTAGLVDRLNAALTRRGVATRVERYASWFYLNPAQEDPLASLLYPLMRLDNVHVYEGFPCFLTTAHSAADIDLIVTAFEHALDQLQAAGILTAGTGSTATTLPPASGAVAAAAPLPDRVPLTEPQQEVYLAAQLGDAASTAFNESISVRLSGDIDGEALAQALNDVIARHDALRGRFGMTGESMEVVTPLTIIVPQIDLTGAADPEQALVRLLQDDANTPFDLAQGPLVRAQLVRLAEIDTRAGFHRAPYHLRRLVDECDSRRSGRSLCRAAAGCSCGVAGGLAIPALCAGSGEPFHARSDRPVLVSDVSKLTRATRVAERPAPSGGAHMAWCVS